MTCWTNLGGPLGHGCYSHKTSMPLPPIVACQHRRYLLECRRKDGFPSTCASYPIQCLFVLLRIRVVRGIVGWLVVGASVINLGKYSTDWLTSASSQSGVESSSISPIPSKHPLIITGIHPSTRFTIDGLLSLKLTINSRAAFRTSSPSSSRGSSFAFPALAGGKSNENEPSLG